MKYNKRGFPSSTVKEAPSASDEDATADLMEQHDQFVSSMQSRLAKLQVIINKVMLVGYLELFRPCEALMI